ncbi:hypothetical protein PR001_g7540 [Phytophthora rubi]|uniref:Reverse transcriptase RNase H-like domain-containing protein n=1 Tax=Phytophthora rubi TaxID=129364 RepID=A0A6A3NDJ6_9STRA|nr:hypothetical protein PR001_g7540 [Phytophthora rubi]
MGDGDEDDTTGDESESEVVSRRMVGGGVATEDAQKELATVFKAEPIDFVAEPVSRLKESLARCMRLEIDFSDEEEATVYLHEGTELLNDLRNQLAALPELKDLSPKADLAMADIDESGVTTNEMEAQLRGDIAYGAETWDQLCVDLDRLPYRLRYWGISVSLPKSEFGKKTISYLSHEIGAEGIRAKPKIAKGVKDVPFPSTLKGLQSFLGSLNYYNKFIEDLPVVAAVLYELTDEQIRAGRDLSRAKEAFEVLKRKIVSTPLLRHPDSEKPFVVIIHANPWAACAVLGQEYDGVIFPVRFTGRVLHDQELRYHPAEKEVVALTRVLRVFYTMLVGTKLIKVFTRHSVLKWIFKSKSLKGRCEQWAVRLAPWPLEIHKIQRYEDGLAAIMGAGITPRDKLDQVAENFIPAKGQVVRAPPISLEMLEADYEGWLLSFDGAAKMSNRRGSAGCILWKLPSWEVVEARGFHFEDATVNEAEYHGLIE